jgi:Dyp-type peroxidase family
MAIDLTKSLAWEAATPDETAMLMDLQGNVLKGHGRDYTAHMFFRFNPAARPATRAFVKALAAKITTQLKQLQDAKVFKQTGVAGPTFFSLYISADGYKALGVSPALLPPDPVFSQGMKNPVLGDPPVTQWEAKFRGEVHAMLLIGDTSRAKVDQARSVVRGMKPTAVKILGEEFGEALYNAVGEGIEHFGYVDGRSQPLLLKEDIAGEAKANWDPEMPLNLALVRDPGGAGPNSHGSFFVFRKLEQDVRGFKAREKALQAVLGPSPAGAMAVGRFEDGTPVVLHQTEQGGPPMNDFNFNADVAGQKCPFQGHIRKMNPRGTSPFEPDAAERRHLMPRRGIPYGQRATHPSDPILDQRPSLAPTGRVGLLFMAHNADIANQFQFVQNIWANNPDFAANGTGLDPLIGQAAPLPQPQKWPTPWGSAQKAAFDFHGFVRMRGGEYFLAPSISSLTAL